MSTHTMGTFSLSFKKALRVGVAGSRVARPVTALATIAALEPLEPQHNWPGTW